MPTEDTIMQGAIDSDGTGGVAAVESASARCRCAGDPRGGSRFVVARLTCRVLLPLACSLPVVGQTEYVSDGNPTAVEEEIRWMVNRARFSTADENLARRTNYAGLVQSAPPLAPHQALTIASRRHSEDMARLGVFQHATVPGSAFYNAVTQPAPWDRWKAEGYIYNQAGENIAAGVSTPEGTYLQWWNSEGHRSNLCDAGLREIGNGHFYLAGSTYRHYYTQALGTSGARHFFTGTIFRDANADGAYDVDEGVAGVRIRLRVQGEVHAWFDVSASSGSFAVPIESIPDRSTVEVLLGNPTANHIVISLPRDYARHDTVSLSPGAELVAGGFAQPTAAVNVGWRNLAMPRPSGPPAELMLTGATGSFEIRWQSLYGLEYEPQASPDLINWTALPGAAILGTGAVMTLNPGAAPPGTTRRFFRMVVRNR